MKSNYFESKKHKKQKAVTESLSVTELFMNSHVTNSLLETKWFDINGEVHSDETYDVSNVDAFGEIHSAVELDWNSLPVNLNPSHGELSDIRAKRL